MLRADKKELKKGEYEKMNFSVFDSPLIALTRYCIKRGALVLIMRNTESAPEPYGSFSFCGQFIFKAAQNLNCVKPI